MQVLMTVDGETERFAISSTGIGVEWSQLKQITNLASHVIHQAGKYVVTTYSDDGKDTFRYEIQQKPFRTYQYINSTLAMIINDYDTLTYAATNASHSTYMVDQDEIITGYEVGVGFTISTEYLFGIP